jgi:hypothetical protein
MEARGLSVVDTQLGVPRGEKCGPSSRDRTYVALVQFLPLRFASVLLEPVACRVLRSRWSERKRLRRYVEERYTRRIGVSRSPDERLWHSFRERPGVSAGAVIVAFVIILVMRSWCC